MTPEPIDPTAKTLDELVLELVEQGNSTAKQLEDLTIAIDTNSRRRRSNNIAAGVVLIALAIVAIFNNVAVRELQNQVCPIVLLWGTNGSDAPPSTERSADIAREADALAERWNCT